MLLFQPFHYKTQQRLSKAREEQQTLSCVHSKQKSCCHVCINVPCVFTSLSRCTVALHSHVTMFVPISYTEYRLSLGLDSHLPRHSLVSIQLRCSHIVLLNPLLLLTPFAFYPLTAPSWFAPSPIPRRFSSLLTNRCLYPDLRPLIPCLI